MKRTKSIEKSPINFLLSNLLKLYGGNLTSIVLFGSQARKNYGKYSDLDLIVVLKKDKSYEVSKLRKEFLIRFEKKLDLHMFTKAEVIENFKDCSPMFSTLLLGKRILFDREGFFEDQFNSFVIDISNLNIKYCEGDKIWEMGKIAKSLEILQ